MSQLLIYMRGNNLLWRQFFILVGTDDPTRATLPFLGALGAVEAGFKAQLALQGEAAFLMLDHLVDQIHGVGWPPLKEVIDQVFEHKIPIFVWGGCAIARGVTEKDMTGKNAELISPARAAELTVAADKIFNY